MEPSEKFRWPGIGGQGDSRGLGSSFLWASSSCRPCDRGCLHVAACSTTSRVPILTLELHADRLRSSRTSRMSPRRLGSRVRTASPRWLPVSMHPRPGLPIDQALTGQARPSTKRPFHARDKRRPRDCRDRILRLQGILASRQRSESLLSSCRRHAIIGNDNSLISTLGREHLEVLFS